MSSIDVQLEGMPELIRKLRKLAGPQLRTVARRVVKTAMAPVLSVAKANAPVGPTGRLRASIGQLADTTGKGSAFSSRVGTRRDFTYTSTSGERIVAARAGKKLESGLAKGRKKDVKSAQQYARGIHFGEDKKGRIRRKAGPAPFLEDAILGKQSSIISTLSSEFRRAVETIP